MQNAAVQSFKRFINAANCEAKMTGLGDLLGEDAVVMELQILDSEQGIDGRREVQTQHRMKPCAFAVFSGRNTIMIKFHKYILQ